MNNVFARPLPSSLNNLSEDFNLFSYLQNSVEEYLPWFFLVMVVMAIFKLAWNNSHREKMRLEKLKKFIVFFLSKRQMMLPLVYTFAAQDQLLDKNALAEILSIRLQAKNMPFKKNPQARMQLEKTVSRILFKYFSSLEKNGKIKSNSKFSIVLKDLEFIDEKLVELQKVYNNEVGIWNSKVIPLRKLLNLSKFEILR